MTSNSSQPSLRPKPLDALVAAVVIALAVVTALLFYLPKTGNGDQLVESEHGDDVGKTQLYAGQRHDKRHGKQVFQCAQTQRQCR